MITGEVVDNRLHAISAAQLRDARETARRTERSVLSVLEEQSGLPPTAFMAALGQALHYPVLSMQALRDLTPDFDLIPYTEALARECVGLRDPAGTLHVAFADPFNAEFPGWIEAKIREYYVLHLAHPTDVSAYLARFEERIRAIDTVQATVDETAERADNVEVLSLARISEDTSTVVKLVNSTLYDALKMHASDVHLETGPHGLAIKYRIDGVLNAIGGLHAPELAEQVISRVKVMAELDIAERRVPQDGRFRVAIKGREIDFRVSVMPSIYGEDAVLRILDKQDLADQIRGVRLDYLGFDGEILGQLHHLASEPYGMVLVTGPTGSGKTTTLYAMISEINNGQDKIITIEDPVEYQLPGVLQIPVNEKKGLTFARGLRSILRHDPDKIMVGEIRDPETAQIAVQSALTGHLVFTTIHANNVFDVIGRFMQMGVDPYSFVSALNAILAQRLVRRVCDSCAVPYEPEAREIAASGLDPAFAASFRFRTGRGCGQCRGTGYKGRTAISELLCLTDEMRELIVAREPIRRIKEAARQGGTRFLREAAVDLVRRGETTLQEINRVTFVA